jgi:hypothetical protein
MMHLDRPPRYRTGTAELAPFWRAQALYRHDISDPDILQYEWTWLSIDPVTETALWRAGFTCYRAIPPCPDWLLRTIPDLGATRVAALRRILPYARDIHAGPLCPGRVLENSGALGRLRPPELDAYLAEQARRQLAGEPELLRTDAVLAGLGDP